MTSQLLETSAPPAAVQSGSRADHTPALDAVRAISAIVVFVSHIIQIIWLPLVGLGSVLHRANSFVSECAVIVFFVLSGYLITLSIYTNARRNHGFSVVQYANSRLLRIYPPFLFSVALVFAVYAVLTYFQLPGSAKALRAPGDLYAARETFDVTRADLIAALSMNGGMLVANGPLWSLYIEAKLYVGAGLAAIVQFLRPLPMSLRFAGCVVCFAAVYHVITQNHPDYVYYGSWWLLGVFAFVWRQSESNWVLLGIAGLFALALATSPLAWFIEAPRYAIISGLCLLTIMKWRSAPAAFVKLSLSSYTLYVIHFPLLILGFALCIEAFAGQPLTLGARFALSLTSFLIVGSIAMLAGSVLENGPLLKRAVARLLGRTSSV